MDGILMNEFLLLALLVVYLVITYVPVSEAPNDDSPSHRDDLFARDSAEIDGGRRSQLMRRL
jgi:hypothetical protein